MLPAVGHGAGLRPGLLSSVEPIGIAGTPKVAGVEVLDCENMALPVAEAGPHGVVIGTAAPGGVAPVMIPTPLASNSVLEPDVPVIALAMPALVVAKPGLEHAVAEATPLEEPELTPGVASAAAPKGIPVGATVTPEVLMPRGEVMPMPTPGLGAPIPPTCAKALLIPRKSQSLWLSRSTSLRPPDLSKASAIRGLSRPGRLAKDCRK